MSNKGRPRIFNPEMEELKKDPIAIPPELFEHLGEFHLIDINGYLHLLITKSQRPPGFYGRYIAVSKMVWSIHNPDYVFDDGDRVRYDNGNILDNRIENLTV